MPGRGSALRLRVCALAGRLRVVAPARGVQRRVLGAAALGGGGCAMGLALTDSLPLPAPAVRCEGEGWSTCAKVSGCCATTLVGGLIFVYNEVQKLMKTFALETVALGGQQIKLDENQAEPAGVKLVAALRGDSLFRERLSPAQQEAAAAIVLEELRLSFGLAILAKKLQDMPENVSQEARQYLMNANEYDPSVPIAALLHAVGMFADAVLQGNSAPPIWIAVYPWLQETVLAVDVTGDGVMDFGEFADCAAHAISLIVSPAVPAGTSALDASIQRAERMFAVVNPEARVTGGKGSTISRETLTEWLRSMIVLGVLPLDNIDRDLKSGSSSLLRRKDGQIDQGLAAVDQLTQQYCVELEIGKDDRFTFDEFSLVICKQHCALVTWA
jgi:hypothetical protein